MKFIITTHNPLFYNVLFNEFNNADSSSGYRVKHSRKWRFEKLIDGTFSLVDQSNDSPFSYHLFLLSEIEKAIESNDIRKYHFSFLRNILEKASTFLGYVHCSHSKHHGEEISILDDNDKRVLGFLVEEIKRMYSFKSTIIPLVTEDDTV